MPVHHLVLIEPQSGSAPPSYWLPCSSAVDAEATALYHGGTAYEAHPLFDATGPDVVRVSSPAELLAAAQARIAQLESALAEALEDRHALALEVTSKWTGPSRFHELDDDINFQSVQDAVDRAVARVAAIAASISFPAPADIARRHMPQPPALPARATKPLP